MLCRIMKCSHLGSRSWIILVVIPLVLIVPHSGEVQIVDSPGEQGITIPVGSRLELRCESRDGANVTWYHNGIIVEDEERRNVRVLVDYQQHTVTSVLLLQESYRHDSGLYECVSQIDITDKDSVNVDFHSYHLGNTVRIISESGGASLHVALGDEFTLRCEASGLTELVWYHNDQQLRTRGPDVFETSAGNVTTNIMTSLLTRRTVGQEAKGRYTCQDLGNPRNQDTVVVTVTERNLHRASIEIMATDTRDMLVLEGDAFTLRCRADPDADVEWYFEGTLASMRTGYVLNKQMQENKQFKYSVLTVENAASSDTGAFLCRNTRAQNDQDQVYVTVKSQAELDAMQTFGGGSLPTDTRMLVMQVGTNINLSCSIASQSNHRITWTKGDADIENDEKFLVTAEDPSVLKIYGTERSDAGVYKCAFRDVDSDSVTGVVLFNLTTPTCPQLFPPENGEFWACPDSPVLGETCGFRCDPGFRVTSRRPLVCRQKNNDQIHWSAPPPQCRHISPSDVDDSVPTTVSNVLLRVGGSLKLQCSQGASWSIRNVELYSGSKYIVEPRAIIIKHTDSADSGMYDCSVFDEEEGNLVGIYKYNVTTLPCPRLFAPRNGTIVGCDVQPMYGTQCRFACNEGFVLKRGSSRRTCELSSLETRVYWTGSPPVCISTKLNSMPFSSSAPTLTANLITLFATLFLLLRFNIQHIANSIT